MQLDVIGTDLRAEALYRCEGFEIPARRYMGLLAPLFGFHHDTRMHCAVPQQG